MSFPTYSSCWLWTGSLNRNGYARIVRKKKTLLVHRVLYQLLYGELQPGIVLDHLCRQRNCCNPAHLEPVTVRTNTLRGNGPTAQRYHNARKKQ